MDLIVSQLIANSCEVVNRGCVKKITYLLFSRGLLSVLAAVVCASHASVAHAVGAPGHRMRTQTYEAFSKTLKISRTARDTKSGFVICIDPGHSRRTVGASANHLKEYVVCWQMAQQLAAILRHGYSPPNVVILTKKSQEAYVSNMERAHIANKVQADLLIRLHCDSGRDAGIATFYPAVQGHIRDETGPSQEVIVQSRRCAYAFHSTLLHALQAQGSPLHDRGVRTDAQTQVGGKLGGALEGSIYSERPVLLIEMCVLNAPGDARFIRSSAKRKILAQAMAAGVLAAIQANRASP